MAERFEALGATLDRPRRRQLIGLAAFLVSLLTCVGVAALVGPIGFLIATFATMIIGTRVVTALAGPRSVVNSEAVVESGSLRIPALELEVPRERVRQGLESGSDGEVILDLAQGETLRLRFDPRQESAEKLLAALGVGDGQHTTSVPLRRTLGRFTIGLVTSFLGVWPASLLAVAITRLISSGAPRPGFVSVPLIFGLTALLTVSVVRRFGSPHVVIGSDGIRISGMLRQPFIRYSEIKRVRSAGWFIVLDLVNGTRRELPVIAVDAARVSGLVRRIERARRRATDGRSFLADSLSRAGRPLRSGRRRWIPSRSAKEVSAERLSTATRWSASRRIPTPEPRTGSAQPTS